MSSLDFPDFPSSSDPFLTSRSSSTSSYGSCDLSPHDRFLSSVLTAFVGSIITGISSGFFVAFCTAWICWVAGIRIVVVGLWEVALAARLKPTRGGDQFLRLLRHVPLLNRSIAFRTGQIANHPFFNKQGASYEPVRVSNEDEEELQHLRGNTPESTSQTAHLMPFPSPSYSREPSPSPAAQGPPTSKIFSSSSRTKVQASNRSSMFRFTSSPPPSILGWIGWIYAALYSPIVQILWLAGNWSDGPSAGNVKLVRAIGVSVTALSLTMDTRARYGESLKDWLGPWAQRTFTIIHAVSCLTLGLVIAILLILAVIQLPAPVFFIPVYLVFSTIWMFGSFLLFPPFDGSTAPNSVPTFLAGLLMGAFGGLFTSAPAFGSMMFASTDGATLKEYLKCDTVDTWHKFIAIFP